MLKDWNLNGFELQTNPHVPIHQKEMSCFTNSGISHTNQTLCITSV